MGTPAAVLGDSVLGTCLHVYQSTTPAPPGAPVPSPVPMSLPFEGTIVEGVPTVKICGTPSVVLGAKVINEAVHPPVGGATIPGPATPEATNQSQINMGSPTVRINGKPAVRTGSTAFPGCGLLAPAVVQGTAVTVMIA